MPSPGGWKEVLGGVVTPELRNYFEQALNGLDGASYEPIALLATQLANGTNYKFQAIAKTVGVDDVEATKIVIINVNPMGVATLISIED